MPEKPTTTIIDSILVSIDTDLLARRLHIGAMPEFRDDLASLVEQARAVARPRGAYKLVTVQPRDDTSVLLDGAPFTSRVLRVNLEGVHRAFPYIATCGSELEEWSTHFDDAMHVFWADAIKEEALRNAVDALGNHLVDVYQPGTRGTMNPGSLEDWPISQQVPLFALFGDVPRQLGVGLTESFLMTPIKSVSGIWFQTEKGFQNCRLCPRDECPNRREPYQPELYDREYRA